VCATATSANCIKSSDVTNWGRYYASVLGLVDNVNVLAVRDATLKAQPFGTNLVNETWNYATSFNAQDTWRISKSLTMSYGLAWGFQPPPKERLGRQTVQIDCGLPWSPASRQPDVHLTCIAPDKIRLLAVLAGLGAISWPVAASPGRWAPEARGALQSIAWPSKMRSGLR
jgi:hypothetical protein